MDEADRILNMDFEKEVSVTNNRYYLITNLQKTIVSSKYSPRYIKGTHI